MRKLLLLFLLLFAVLGYSFLAGELGIRTRTDFNESQSLIKINFTESGTDTTAKIIVPKYSTVETAYINVTGGMTYNETRLYSKPATTLNGDVENAFQHIAVPLHTSGNFISITKIAMYDEGAGTAVNNISIRTNNSIGLPDTIICSPTYNEPLTELIDGWYYSYFGDGCTLTDNTNYWVMATKYCTDPDSCWFDFADRYQVGTTDDGSIGFNASLHPGRWYNLTKAGNYRVYGNTNTTNVTISIGGTTFFNHSGALETVNRTSFTNAANDYLSYCTADISRNCSLPLTVSSDRGGDINLSELELNYTFIDLTNCSHTSTTQTLNFTMLNESNDAPVSGSQEMVFDVTRLTTNELIAATNYSYEFSGNSSAVCIAPVHRNHTVDMMLEYSASGYSTRYYYLDGVSLSNITEYINLYLIPTTEDDKLTITVNDENEAAIGGAVVQINKYDVGSNSYTMVATGETDPDGQVDVYLDFDNWYQFKVLIDGDLKTLKGGNQWYIDSATLTLTVVTTGIGAWWDYYDTTAYNCSYTNSTKKVNCEYSDTSNLLTSMRFLVRRVVPSGYQTICDQSQTAVSGTFSCTLPNNTDGNTYNYQLRGTFQSPDIVFVNEIVQFLAAGTFGSTGVLAMVFMVIGGGLAGITGGAVAGVFGVMMGYLIAVLSGIAPLKAEGVVMIMILGGVLIVFMKK